MLTIVKDDNVCSKFLQLLQLGQQLQERGFSQVLSMGQFALKKDE